MSLGSFPLFEHFHVGFRSIHITNAFTHVILSSAKNKMTGHRREERMPCKLQLLFGCTLLQSPVSSAHHLLSTDRDAMLLIRPQLYSLLVHGHDCKLVVTRNSSGDEIANVNFLYDDIVHVLQNTIDSYIPPQIDAAVMCGTHVYQIQRNNAM